MQTNQMKVSGYRWKMNPHVSVFTSTACVISKFSSVWAAAQFTMSKS